jgi:ketosteroid isomerase-like protein
MRIPSLVLMFALLAPPAGAAGPVVLPDPDTLRAQVAARDLAFFDVQFEQCAPERMRAMVTEDVEFFHDKGGLVKGADAFVAMYEKMCTERKAPGAWRSRRKLVEGTLHVDPVPGFGAIETGEHTFHERRGDGPQKLVGRAKFAIVWQLAADGWRMSRILSYAHGPASE